MTGNNGVSARKQGSAIALLRRGPLIIHGPFADLGPRAAYQLSGFDRITSLLSVTAANFGGSGLVIPDWKRTVSVQPPGGGPAPLEAGALGRSRRGRFHQTRWIP
jgi:hypothetical protein